MIPRQDSNLDRIMFRNVVERMREDATINGKPILLRRSAISIRRQLEIAGARNVNADTQFLVFLDEEDTILQPRQKLMVGSEKYLVVDSEQYKDAPGCFILTANHID